MTAANHFNTVISLCDGISLARDSLRCAGITCDKYIGVEIEEEARKISDWRCATDGMPPVIRPVNDIRKFRRRQIAAAFNKGESVLIIAGIPCTERSLANKYHTGAGRVGEGTQSGLIRDFARILKACRARAARVEFIVENVPSAPEANQFYDTMLGVVAVEVNAAAFGAQHRNRLFWASWHITPPRREEWSKEVFADIAEENPAGARYYDYILYPSARHTDGKPHRVGVLGVPAVLKQINAGLLADAQGERTYSENGKMTSHSATRGGKGCLVSKPPVTGGTGGRAYADKNKLPPVMPSGRATLVCNLPNGGPHQDTVASPDEKCYAFKKTGVKIAVHPPQPQIYGGDGKAAAVRGAGTKAKARSVVASNGGRRQNLVAIKTRALDGTGEASACVQSPNEKTRAITAGAGNDPGKKMVAAALHPSTQDRIYDAKGKIKTIPAHGGGRTEGMVTEPFSASNRVNNGDKKMATITRNKNGLSQYVNDDADMVMRQEFEMKDGTVITLLEPVPVLIKSARALTVTEIERLFGLPDGATAAPGISRSARIRCLGGGWDVRQMGFCLRALREDGRKASSPTPLLQ